MIMLPEAYSQFDMGLSQQLLSLPWLDSRMVVAMSNRHIPPHEERPLFSDWEGQIVQDMGRGAEKSLYRMNVNSSSEGDFDVRLFSYLLFNFLVFGSSCL